MQEFVPVNWTADEDKTNESAILWAFGPPETQLDDDELVDSLVEIVQQLQQVEEALRTLFDARAGLLVRKAVHDGELVRRWLRDGWEAAIVEIGGRSIHLEIREGDPEVTLRL